MVTHHAPLQKNHLSCCSVAPAHEVGAGPSCSRNMKEERSLDGRTPMQSPLFPIIKAVYVAKSWAPQGLMVTPTVRDS